MVEIFGISKSLCQLGSPLAAGEAQASAKQSFLTIAAAV
jgi:hypothetical protein